MDGLDDGIEGEGEQFQIRSQMLKLVLIKRALNHLKTFVKPVTVLKFIFCFVMILRLELGQSRVRLRALRF